MLTLENVKNKKILISILILLAPLTALGVYYSKRSPLTSPDCLIAKPMSIQETINVTGLINPRLSVNLTAEKTGKVLQLMVKEGDIVRKGQIVALLDTRDIDLQIKNKSKELKEVVLKAAKLESSARRILSLANKDILPKSEIEETEANIYDIRAELASGNGEILILQRERVNNQIFSPFDGVVAQIFAFPGTFVSPMTAASDSDQSTKSTILQIYSDLQVVINSPEASVFDILNAIQISVTPTTDSRMVIPARVDRVMPYVILTTSKVSAIPIRLSLADQRPFLPGMNVDVQAVKPTVTGLALRKYALVKKNNLTGVYLCSDKATIFEPVSIIGGDDGFALVKSTKRLQPGTKYRTTDPKAQAKVGFLGFFKGKNLDQLKEQLNMNPLK